MVTTSTPSSTLSVIDTNVLVYAVDSESPFHAASKALLDSAVNDGTGLCVTSQIVAEFCAVVTDRRRVRNPLDPATASSIVRKLVGLPGMSFLMQPVGSELHFADLLAMHPRVGPRVFDLFLVAVMLGNGVRRIYTFNKRDFESIEGIEVETP